MNFRLFTTLLGLLVLPSMLWAGEPPEFARSPDGIQPRKSAEAAAVAKDGEALLPVVVHSSASARTRAAAAEVAARLSEMSGAVFEVIEGDGARGIVIGTLKEFPDPEISEAMKPFGTLKEVDGFDIAADTDKEGRRMWGAVEAFGIRTGAERIRLMGNTDRGAFFAAGRFLELLGVRQLTLSPKWLVVPEMKTISFDADEEQAPDFFLREIRFAFGVLEPELAAGEMGDQQRWHFYNRWGQAFNARTHHMYSSVFTRNKEEFQTNKEKYYAQRSADASKEDWKSPGKFNLSEPRVREMITETVMQGYTDRRTGEQNFMSSGEPSDGGGWCLRPESLAMGSISDRAFLVANETAQAVAKKYPERMVGHLAYYQHVDPPTFDLEPNLFVHLATRLNHGSYPMETLLELWPKKTQNLGVYEYLSTFVWGQDRIRDPGAYAPAASWQTVSELIRRYYALGYRFFKAESCLNFAIYGPGYYTALAVLWNINTDEAALMDDYYEKAFGPARGPMQKFYERMDPRSGRVTHINFYADLVRYLDEATLAASQDPKVLARLDELKNFLYMEYLYYQLPLARQAKDDAKYQELHFRLLEHVHRIRFSYSNHYTAHASKSQKRAATFDDATWQEGRRKGEAPWQQKEAPTSEETKELFQQVREFFQPVPLQEIDFGPGVTVVDLSADNPRPDGDAQEIFATSSRKRPTLHLFSPDGQPLRLRVNLAAPRSERFETVYPRIMVRDAEGREIFAESKAQKVGEELGFDLEVPLPGPGEYVVEVTSPRSVLLPKEGAIPFQRSLNNMGWSSNLLFFVPAETEVLHIYASSPDELTFTAPDGTLLKTKPDDTRLASLEVPPAWRGKLWSAKPGSAFTLLNAPNLFSYDPSRVILPTSLAQKARD